MAPGLSLPFGSPDSYLAPKSARPTSIQAPTRLWPPSGQTPEGENLAAEGLPYARACKPIVKY